MEKLFSENEESLLRLFRSRTGDVQESMDLMQDLFESVMDNLDAFSRVENQIAWLFRAAHNKVTDWYRKKQRRRDVSLSAVTEDGNPMEELLKDRAPDLEDQFFRNELLEALSAAVESLPEPLRQIIVAQSLEGRTFRELSGEWGIPQGTLLSRKREAVRLLREALDDFTDVYRDIIGGDE